MRLVLLLLAFSLGGCESLGYYAQSARGQLALSLASRPLPEVLDDPAVSAQHKARLRLSREMLAFAGLQLALPASDSYRRYADVGREALVWSVVATPRFSLQPKQWCYPVIGCASYRGYFERSAAQGYAKRLREQGLDVAIDRVPAYSTLGWFHDPIPSTVIHWPEAEFAGLLFHELAHQRVYAKDDSAFNESYARVVELAGIEAWLHRQSAAAEMAAWQQRRKRGRAFNRLLADTRERLRVLYASGMETSQLAVQKDALFAQLQREYQALRASWDGYPGYDAWMSRPLNNAHLASIETYSRWQPALRRLLGSLGGDMQAFHAACEQLAELEYVERQQQLEQLLSGRRASSGHP